MPGLLDMFGGDADPKTQGLLAAAAQILQASGPSLMPHSFGQIAGAGVQGFQQGREQALQQQRERMQMDMLAQQVASATRKNNLINNVIESTFGGGQQSPQAPQAPQPLPMGSTDSDGRTISTPGFFPPSSQASQPSAPGVGAAGFGGVPSSAIAADLAFNNGAKIGEWVNDRAKPTDFAKQLIQSGIAQGSPLFNQLMQANVAKQNYVAPVNTRPGSIIRDPFTQKPIAYNPHIPDGGTPLFDASGNVVGVNALPGATDVTEGMARATAAGKNSVEPITAYDGTQPVFTNKKDAASGGASYTGAPLTPESLEKLKGWAAAGDANSKMLLDAYTASQNKRLTPGLAPGMAESQSALATTGAKRYTDLISQASESPTRVNVYDNILNLSREGVASGPGEAWKNKVKGFAANTPLLGSVVHNWRDDVAGFQELNKFMYQNAQRNWQAAGGTGTDSQLEAFTKANPNDTMFPQALQKMAEWGKAGELALQGKANAMQQWKDANGGNVANQDQFERAWRNNFDPVLFQLKTMDPQSAAQYVANMKAKDPKGYANLMMKATALKNIGGL
jgi:hypothetical protein